MDFSGPTCRSYSYFIRIFYVKVVFLVISMIKIVILDQSKPILPLYLKIKKSKIQKYEIRKL